MVTVVDVSFIALLAGAATGIGALPILVAGRVSHRLYDGALGLAAGIMVGAAVFALVVPGLELGTLAEVTGGMVVGGAFLLAANWAIPHAHLLFGGTNGEEFPESESLDELDDDLRQALLIGSSITIHNVPEGLAVGIAFASGFEEVGLALAAAIAVQNVPDGFAMAVPASQTGLSNARTILYTTLSGAIPEPLAAAAGFALVALVTGIFPVAAGFAAGAMMAVVFRELIPESHSHGYADTATITFILGFVVMVGVDVGLAV
ncbi:MAG: ZIP family metal transporter [Halohasta sp.]